MNPFSHIDVRVADMDAALAFYERLLPALGFTRRFDGPIWKVFATEGDLPSAAYFSIVEDRSHRPNANRIAFWRESPEEVDRIGAVLNEIGAKIESGPGRVEEYPGEYYAVFFEDPSGNLLEIVHWKLEMPT